MVGQMLVPHNFGMTNQIELLNLPDAIIRGLGAINSEGKSILEHLLASIDEKPFSIWALKSGCMLLLEDKAFKDIYEMLTDPRDQYLKDEQLRQIYKGFALIEEAMHGLDQETVKR